ncbi:MAG TPA: riboflavin synthase [Tepidisphaeraceae bacterium]|nr:riboflavin synthase [Tepidisphaeraceae bacterium]
MFTGIIERTARVIGVSKGPAFWRLTISSHWDDVRDGESIAINGVCLTVAELRPGEIGFDVVKETLSKTNLGLLTENDSVHVERSLRVGDRVSGHFVQGHVDGLANLVSQGSDQNDEWRFVLETTPDLAKYLTPKGSVALDGVSLTIAAVKGNRFEIALIPTTLQITALGRREVGWPFNLEVDVLTKTVVSFLEWERAGIK